MEERRWVQISAKTQEEEEEGRRRVLSKMGRKGREGDDCFSIHLASVSPERGENTQTTN